MKRTIFTLIVCFVTIGMLSAQRKSLTITPASKPVVADGVIDGLDPWVAGDWVDVAMAGAANTTTDMSAKFQLKYDKDNLYFGAVVVDGDRWVNTGANTYQNDCIEFFIAIDTNSAVVDYKANDRQIRLQAIADPGAVGGTIDGTQQLTTGTYVCVDNGTDYVQEWVMAWADLTVDMDPAWEGKEFKFDIQVASATGTQLRTQQMFWNNNSDQQWHNTSTFGNIYLETPIAELGGAYVPNPDAKLIIEVASKPVVADGVIDASDPWSANAWVDVAYAGAANTTTDMSAKFQLMYDKTNLYFGAVVVDADRWVNTGANTYQNDCIEFFIAMDTNSVVVDYKANDRQIRLQAIADPTAAGGTIDGTQQLTTGTYVCADNGTDYVQEWVMPWADLAVDMDPAWEGKDFKFDIQVASASGTQLRTQQMFWNNNSDQQWHNTSTFGLIALREEISSLPSAVKDVKTSKSLIYVSGNQLKGVKGMVSVYDITGKLVLKSVSKDGTLSVASLKQGIYIVNSNNSAAKISIR